MGKNHGKIRVDRFAPGSKVNRPFQENRPGADAPIECFSRKLKRRGIIMLNKIKKISISPIGQFCIILAILYLILSGCASEKNFKKTVNNIQVFPEQEKGSLRAPLSSAVIATADVLASSGFSIIRIELQRDYASVDAVKGNTRMDCRLNILTEDLTRIRVKVHNSDLISDPTARPDVIIEKIRSFFVSGVLTDWSDVTKNMTQVHVRPDEKSPAAAYLAPGAEATLYTDFDDPSWSRVKLNTGGYGYVMKRNLKPAPFKPL
jgi:hypothetical protein